MVAYLVELVRQNAKAVVAFVVASVALWLANHGVTVDASITDAVTTLLAALIVAIPVQQVPNRLSAAERAKIVHGD